MTQVPESKEYLLTNDGGPDVRFDGVLLHSVKKTTAGLRTYLHMYQTSGGSVVVHETAHVIGDPAVSTSKVYSAKCPVDLTGVLGFSKLAKELYIAAGIDATKLII